MAGELVPLVMLPRYSTYAGATTFYTIAMDVTEYQKAILNFWRGPGPGTPNVELYFEESTDSINWSACTNVASPETQAADTEVQYTPDLKKRWFRVRLVLSGTNPVVSCWAVGFLERRES